MYKEPVPIGNRILVEVEIDEQKAIKSDFVVLLASTTDEQNARALLSTNIGKVLSLGKLATETGLLTDSEHEIMPGHMVLFIKNAGVSFKHPDETKVYRLLSKGDIMAVVGNAVEGE